MAWLNCCERIEKIRRIKKRKLLDKAGKCDIVLDANELHLHLELFAFGVFWYMERLLNPECLVYGTGFASNNEKGVILC